AWDLVRKSLMSLLLTSPRRVNFRIRVHSNQGHPPSRLPQLRGCASHRTMQELTLRKEEIGNALLGAAATREDRTHRFRGRGANQRFWRSRLLRGAPTSTRGQFRRNRDRLGFCLIGGCTPDRQPPRRRPSGAASVLIGKSVTFRLGLLH